MNDSDHLTIACIHCGADIELPAQAGWVEIECPHCGWQTPVHDPNAPRQEGAPHDDAARSFLKSGPALLGLIALLLAGTMAAFLLWPRSNPPKPSPDTRPTDPGASQNLEAIPDGLHVSSISLRDTPGTSLVHAVGAITNQSTKQRFGLKITLTLLDAEGQSLGASTDYRDILEPGAVWDFKVLVINPKTVSAKLKSLSEEE